MCKKINMSIYHCWTNKQERPVVTIMAAEWLTVTTVNEFHRKIMINKILILLWKNPINGLVYFIADESDGFVIAWMVNNWINCNPQLKWHMVTGDILPSSQDQINNFGHTPINRFSSKYSIIFVFNFLKNISLSKKKKHFFFGRVTILKFLWLRFFLF